MPVCQLGASVGASKKLGDLTEVWRGVDNMCRESSNSQYLQYRNTRHAKASPILKPVGFKKYFLMEGFYLSQQ